MALDPWREWLADHADDREVVEAVARIRGSLMAGGDRDAAA